MEPPPPHVLIFPYPAQGHMLAHLDLAHQLSLRGLTLTVLVTPKNLPLLAPLLSAHPSVQPLVLPFPPHPKLPPGVENVRDIGNAGNVHIISALSALRLPLSRWFASHPNPPVAIFSDFFLGWTQDLAAELGIPRIAFFSVAAFFTLVIDSCWRNMESVRRASTEAVELSDVPGAPSFREEHLPSIFRLYKESDPDWEIVKRSMLGNMDSWGCVFNTLDHSEGQYLEHLRRKMGHRRVYSVGPLNLIGLNDALGRGDLGGAGTGPGSDVLGWLDGCPDGSVLYVCFGSQKLMTKEQMEALASGLERSGARFVWVVKTPTAEQAEEGYGAVPDGFEALLAGRGKVVTGWAPQVPILRHRAVGGFLSHCGWNSVQEAAVAGKMVLAWPMEADQFVNARLLVEDMGVAVRACEGARTVPDPEELGRAIEGSMREGLPERARVRELRRKAVEAVEPGGGSSWRGLDEFVKELGRLQNQRTV
ncbi:UDP-glycosyltransferase 89A2-like [Rhodamnia argentea]|uniref:UDP-glycosyltransferase 89A2-like n=1 Tax=Rhodamnia argentea TaxID=178133 RepID=A0A8B8QRX2_9MYRT|nr:UDP-glycosyltransferase 89A2-like [Rhodamnia argentea]